VEAKTDGRWFEKGHHKKFSTQHAKDNLFGKLAKVFRFPKWNAQPALMAA